MSICTEAHLKQLCAGLVELNVILDKKQVDALIHFLNLLSKWNKTYNLTAITDPQAMVIQHLFDSLAVCPYLKEGYLIDVGTGAGLPGLPLAISNPNKQFVLLDSLRKRTQFLQQVVYELKLTNVNVVNSRVEDYRPDIRFNQIISRAFASMRQMVKSTEHLQTNSAQILAMKGANFAEELEEIEDTYTIIGIHRLKIPGSSAIRNLIILEDPHSG